MLNTRIRILLYYDFFLPTPEDRFVVLCLDLVPMKFNLTFYQFQFTFHDKEYFCICIIFVVDKCLALIHWQMQ